MALKRIIENDTVHLLDGDTTILSIQETVGDSGVTVSLTGAARSDTAHDLSDELMALTVLGMDLTVNMEKVHSICAGCQHVLLQVQQKMDELGAGSLLLTGLPQSIVEEFDKTGLSDLLDIE